MGGETFTTGERNGPYLPTAYYLPNSQVMVWEQVTEIIQNSAGPQVLRVGIEFTPKKFVMWETAPDKGQPATIRDYDPPLDSPPWCLV